MRNTVCCLLLYRRRVYVYIPPQQHLHLRHHVFVGATHNVGFFFDNVRLYGYNCIIITCTLTYVSGGDPTFLRVNTS